MGVRHRLSSLVGTTSHLALLLVLRPQRTPMVRHHRHKCWHSSHPLSRNLVSSRLSSSSRTTHLGSSAATPRPLSSLTMVLQLHLLPLRLFLPE